MAIAGNSHTAVVVKAIQSGTDAELVKVLVPAATEGKTKHNNMRITIQVTLTNANAFSTVLF